MSLQNERFRIDFSWALLTSPFHAAKGEIFILTDCICSSYQSTVVQLPFQAREPSFAVPLLCIMATCVQPGLSETIKRLESPVSSVTMRSNGPIVSPQLNATHSIRHKTWQPAPLPPLTCSRESMELNRRVPYPLIDALSNCYSQNEPWQHVSMSYQAPPLREKWLSAAEISYWHTVE